MSESEEDQRRRVVEQFTLQATPFSRMPPDANRFVLEAAEVRADDTVLDVACGPGLLACEFAAVARHVTGIDLTPAMIDRAKTLQAKQQRQNITWIVGDVLSLPFSDASFSLVFTRYSFHHILNPKQVLAEMVRVCSPNGRIVVVDVFTSNPEQAEAFNRMEKLRDPSHVRALSLDELMGLFEQANLKVEKSPF